MSSVAARPAGLPPVALRRRAGRHRRALLVQAGATVLLLIVLLPVLWLVQMSFRPNGNILSFNLSFTPTLANYAALWNGAFPHSFVNSLEASGISTILSLLFGVPAAYVLSRWRFRGGGRWRCGSWRPAWRRRSPSRFRSSWPIAICT